MSGALVKGLAALVVIAAAIALGTFVMVRALGLDEGPATSPAATADATDASEPLPTTALPVPGQESPSEEASEEASESPGESESPSPRTQLQLDVSPQQVGPGQRINLTGRYRGGNDAQLQVQRFEGGAWADFPVTASVSSGTFQTWIQTSRTGEQRLRMLDRSNQTASNEVTVRVG